MKKQIQIYIKRTNELIEKRWKNLLKEIKNYAQIFEGELYVSTDWFIQEMQAIHDLQNDRMLLKYLEKDEDVVGAKK